MAVLECYLVHANCTFLVTSASYSVLVALRLERRGLAATRIRLCSYHAHRFPQVFKGARKILVVLPQLAGVFDAR
jgi:hypothetical protein